jgi:hypothetical protein
MNFAVSRIPETLKDSNNITGKAAVPVFAWSQLNKQFHCSGESAAALCSNRPDVHRMKAMDHPIEVGGFLARLPGVT